MELVNPISNTFPVGNLFQISTDVELIKKIQGKLIWMNCGQIG
jgi:hypothetical protein